MSTAIQRRVIVGIADMKVSTEPSEILVTHALGSCVGVTVYDPKRRIGGLMHVMLPLSSTDIGKARNKPFMFMDSGLDALLRTIEQLGADRRCLQVSAAGGASFSSSETSHDIFEIGKRNIIILRKLLWRNGVLLQQEDLGGNLPRNLSLEIATGEVKIWTSGSSGGS